MQCLVLGATGIIGNHVIRELNRQGIKPRALSRGQTPKLNLKGLALDYLEGDLTDRETLHRALAGCDTLFHTAPYYATTFFGRAEHLKKAMAGLETVLTAARENHLKKIVFTSSPAALGQPVHPDELVTEQHDPHLSHYPHPYFELKVAMHDRIAQAVAEGLPIVTVVPMGVFGPYELKPPTLCLMAQMAKGRIRAYIEGRANIIAAADVAHGHVAAARVGHIGERYILGSHNVTTTEVLALIARALGNRPPHLQVPFALAAGASLATEVLAHITHSSVPLLPYLGLCFVKYGQWVDTTKAQSELGLKRSTMEKCLADAVQWFREIGYF